MKVKFRFGIKSYSGTLDELNYANFEDRSVVIGRMLPANREITAQNLTMGSRLTKISQLFAGVSEGFKADLTAYAKKMYKLKAYRKGVAGNKFSTFTKMIWEASKDTSSPLGIDSLSVDDMLLGSYSQISTVKDAIDNGYLPKVEDYESYSNPITG